MDKITTRRRTRSLWLAAFAAVAALSGLVLLSACGGGSESAKAGATDGAGAHAVGRTRIDWRDSTRPEQCGDAPAGTPRRLQATIWYPAATTRGAAYAPLLPTETLALISMTQSVDPTALARLPSHSHDEARLATSANGWPVLLMSHAMGSASPLLYASTAETLAARGYVVVGISHTFDALATFYGDGSVAFRDPGCGVGLDVSSRARNGVDTEAPASQSRWNALDAYLARDIDSTLDELDRMNATSPAFGGRLRLQQVGVFGHSFGGSHAFRALRDNARVVAAANIDGALYAHDFAQGVSKPYLSISSADKAADVARRDLSVRATFEASRPAYHVFLPMALHDNFTDAGLWDAWGVQADPESLNLADAKGILEVQNTLLGRFFDRHLRGLAVSVVLPTAGLRGATLQTR